MQQYHDIVSQILASQACIPHLVTHSQRVASLALEIGRTMNLKATELDQIYTAGLIHDCGLIRLRPTLWTKRGALTWMDKAELRVHPVRGGDQLRDYPELEDIRWCIYHHHERWDGNGYPSRLANTDIPPFARVIGLAEALVSMVSSHPYRVAWSPQAALDEISRCAGSQFDPNLVELITESSEPLALLTPAWPEAAMVALAS